MEYNKLNLTNGTKLDESHFAHIENGIWNNTNELNGALGQIRALQTNISSLAEEGQDLFDMTNQIASIVEDQVYNEIIPMNMDEFYYMFHSTFEDYVEQFDLDSDEGYFLMNLIENQKPLRLMVQSWEHGAYGGPTYLLNFDFKELREGATWTENGSAYISTWTVKYSCIFQNIQFDVTFHHDDDENPNCLELRTFMYPFYKELGDEHYNVLFLDMSTDEIENLGGYQYEVADFEKVLKGCLDRTPSTFTLIYHDNIMNFNLEQKEYDNGYYYYYFKNTKNEISEEGKLNIIQHIIKYSPSGHLTGERKTITMQ